MKTILCLLVAVLLLGCSQPENREQEVVVHHDTSAVLIDTSSALNLPISLSDSVLTLSFEVPSQAFSYVRDQGPLHKYIFVDNSEMKCHLLLKNTAARANAFRVRFSLYKLSAYCAFEY
jgi:hypothetical protein